MINNVPVKMVKGCSVSDFYYSCIFSDFNFINLKEHVRLNYWWFNKLTDEAKEQIRNKINKLGEFYV